jgi:3-dehydroquinate synthase
VVTVPPGEGTKALGSLEPLYEACLDHRLGRNDAIVALGGGVIGDLAGFVAATYLRGIDFIQVPTTLLAMVDASVGGKVAVNLPRGKNLVGAFHQPRCVVIELDVLRTLPPRELSAGLAEVVKHGVIRDAAYFQYVAEQAAEIRALAISPLARTITGSCRIKAAVVQADETESDLRQILNFGHTLGHAIEAVQGYGGLLHGEAVAIGMVAASRIARITGVLQEPDLVERLEAVLQDFALPVRLPPGVKADDLLAATAYDKKAGNWVLPVRLGEVKVTRDVAVDAVRQALAEVGGE